MRIVLQRVLRAGVKVEGRITGEIGRGLLALVCVGVNDTEAVVARMAEKTVQLRVFADEQGKLNRSLLESGGALLAVSQFTLYADCKKGRRPFFRGAAQPETAKKLFDLWIAEIRKTGVCVEQGVFAAMMEIELVNDGPVTIILDSDEI